MARQTGIIKVRGTVGGITFYKLNGIYYARAKTSLSKERVQQDAAFARSRRSSAFFGTAAKLAKVVYRKLPVSKKGHGIIGRLTAKANRLLHEGVTANEVLAFLLEHYLGASAQVLLQRAVQCRKGVIGNPEIPVENGVGAFVSFEEGIVYQHACNGIYARSG